MTGVTDGDPVGIAVTVIEGVASTGMSGDSPPGAASAGPASGDASGDAGSGAGAGDVIAAHAPIAKRPMANTMASIRVFMVRLPFCRLRFPFPTKHSSILQ